MFNKMMVLYDLVRLQEQKRGKVGCYTWLIGSAFAMAITCSIDPGKSLVLSLEARDPLPGMMPFETIRS
jgi:hypothetical protein